jgi:hypothetical protein
MVAAKRSAMAADATIIVGKARKKQQDGPQADTRETVKPNYAEKEKQAAQKGR